MMRRFDAIDGMMASACLIGVMLGCAFQWWWLIVTLVVIFVVYVVAFWRYPR